MSTILIKRTEPLDENNITEIKCPKCSAFIQEGQKYCSNCGSAFSWNGYQSTRPVIDYEALANEFIDYLCEIESPNEIVSMMLDWGYSVAQMEVLGFKIKQKLESTIDEKEGE